MGQEWCGKWMPRKKTTCARTLGHRGPCKTAETMDCNRLYNRDYPHRESPESRKKSNRKYRISSYGLTQELFDLLLEAQQNACGMYHDPFEDGQLINVDHYHACCRGKNRSCGECIRGLLCHTCNIALGQDNRDRELEVMTVDIGAGQETSLPVIQVGPASLREGRDQDV
jgi:hypothetical protein